MKRRRQVVIKGSSLPVLRIVVRDGDASSLRREITDTLEGARPLLAEAIAVLDLREREPGDAGVGAILAAVRDASVRLAAVLIGERSEREALASVDLPVIEVPLSARDRPGHAAELPAAAETPEPTSIEPPVPSASAGADAQHGSEQPSAPDLAPAYLLQPLRSGQRFYAQGRDAVVVAPTSPGSELIADGSIYAFSPLRGRVLAGASGNVNACIVASHLDAELVAVAGVYRVLEADDLKPLGSGPVSVALSLDADGGERLTLAPLPSSSSIQRK